MWPPRVFMKIQWHLCIRDFAPFMVYTKWIINDSYYYDTDFPHGASGKEPACQCRRYGRLKFDPGVRKILWRNLPHSRILAWRIPWTEETGLATIRRVPKLDMTEQLSTAKHTSLWYGGKSLPSSLPACLRVEEGQDRWSEAWMDPTMKGGGVRWGERWLLPHGCASGNRN